MKKLICAMLLILSASYAIDAVEQTRAECLDLKNIQACKKYFYAAKSLCDKGYDIYCYRLGMIYSTGRYGIAENQAKALEYFKVLCDKGWMRGMTCKYTALIYSGALGGVLKNCKQSKIYERKVCNADNQASCDFLRQFSACF